MATARCTPPPMLVTWAPAATPVRIIETAEHLAATAGPDYRRLADRYATLGYRGHPITKTRRYSVTFGQLRRARRTWRQRPRHDPFAVRELAGDADVDEDQAVVVIREWTYAGTGYLDTETAAMALESAVRARSRNRRGA
jgi:hypothetical protein